MAHKRKTKTKHRRKAVVHHKSRRRRVGAVAMSASNPMVLYGSIAAGFFLGSKINAQITKMIGDKVDAKIVGAGEAGLGFLLALKKGRKKSMLQVVGGGVLLGAGVKQLMASFGIGGIGPYGNVPVLGRSAPYGNVPVLGRLAGGYNPHGSLAAYNPHGSLATANGTPKKVMSGVNLNNAIAAECGSGYMN